jgi:hypothetical protein
MSESSLALRRVFVLAGYAVLALIFTAAYVNDRSSYAYFSIALAGEILRTCSQGRQGGRGSVVRRAR